MHFRQCIPCFSLIIFVFACYPQKTTTYLEHEFVHASRPRLVTLFLVAPMQRSDKTQLSVSLGSSVHLNVGFLDVATALEFMLVNTIK